ncbi:hypothetical protein FRC02_007799 [Tulasnella sp. 418]|nr:hypothetical protein FRC02_007799 [Tulasnella sp. 418]
MSELETLESTVQNIKTALANIEKVAQAQIATHHRHRNQLVSTILQLPNETIPRHSSIYSIQYLYLAKMTTMKCCPISVKYAPVFKISQMEHPDCGSVSMNLVPLDRI